MQLDDVGNAPLKLTRCMRRKLPAYPPHQPRPAARQAAIQYILASSLHCQLCFVTDC